MVLLRRYETAVEEAVAHPDDVKLQKNLLDLQQEMDNKYAWQLESEAKAVLNQLGAPIHLQGQHAYVDRHLILPSSVLNW